jgi:hypothetical protein
MREVLAASTPLLARPCFDPPKQPARTRPIAIVLRSGARACCALPPHAAISTPLVGDLCLVRPNGSVLPSATDAIFTVRSAGHNAGPGRTTQWEGVTGACRCLMIRRGRERERAWVAG